MALGDELVRKSSTFFDAEARLDVATGERVVREAAERSPGISLASRRSYDPEVETEVRRLTARGGLGGATRWVVAVSELGDDPDRVVIAVLPHKEPRHAFWQFVTGYLPGFTQYERFLHELRRAVKREQPDATVRIGQPDDDGNLV